MNGAQPARGPAEAVEEAVARVSTMNVDALRFEWRKSFGSDPPSAFSKDLLARAIAYQLQEAAYGGLSPSAARLLRSLLKPGAEPPRQVKAGSVIVREHKGVVHEVLVVPGGFCWQGKSYQSLSTIAKKITGVSWNGPRFFGLRSKQEPSEPTGGPNDPASSAHGAAGRDNAGTAGSMSHRRPGRRSSVRTGSLASSETRS